MLKKVKDSNYELLRIISMFSIVLWHTIIHGNLLQNTTSSINFAINALLFLIIVHVNIFMLISGYYQSKSSFKFKKILSLILQVWFYNFCINTVLYAFGIAKYTNIEYFNSISFFNLTSYWYIQCYFIVYLLSPFLNKFINICTRTELKKVIMVSLFCLSVLPFLTFNLFYQTYGSTVMQYIMLYFVGAYIRKYNLNKNYITRFNYTQKRLLYFCTFILSWLFNLSLFYFATFLNSLDSNIIKYVSNSLIEFRYYYSNPLVIVQAISLFLLFGTFNIKSNVINKVSSLTLGVYLIHEAKFFQSNLYVWLGIDQNHMIYSRQIIIRLFIVSVGIFCCCLIIEFIRSMLFKIITKLKFANEANTNIMNFITNLVKL